MPSQTVDETKTTPSKATVAPPKIKPFTESPLDAKALKLWNEGKAKGSQAIFMQAEGVAIFLKAHREEDLKGEALNQWLKANMEITYGTAVKWDAIHQAKAYLEQLNLPSNWTLYFDAASKLFNDTTPERADPIIKAFRIHTKKFLPGEISSETISMVQAKLGGKDIQKCNITIGDDEMVNVDYPLQTAPVKQDYGTVLQVPTGGVRSTKSGPLDTPEEIKARKRAETESKAALTPEQKKEAKLIELQEELQELGEDDNDIVFDPKELFARMKAEQVAFQDLQIKIAMKRLMREFGIKSAEVELIFKSKAVAA
jgi:hypothetical protein